MLKLFGQFLYLSEMFAHAVVLATCLKFYVCFCCFEWQSSGTHFFFSIEMLNRTLMGKTDKSAPCLQMETQRATSLPAHSLPCCSQDMSVVPCD